MLPEEGEYLTTGWESELDAADSLVRQALLAHVSWAQAIARASRGRSTDRPGWAAGCGGHPSPMLNWVLVKQPPSDWPALVEEVRDFLPAGVAALFVSPFPTTDLAVLGLRLLGHPPIMLRPAAPDAPPPRTSLDVRLAETPDQLADAEGVLVEGYPLPDLADLPPGDFYRSEFLGDSTVVFVGYADGSPVATAVAHSAAGVTVVENVAVLSAARGRGAGAAITWAATRAWPGQPAMLIASDDGQPVYERLGYLRLVRWTCWLLQT
jgi:hypothetical protein